MQKAQKDNPKQWQNWWWVCFAAQVLFIPFIFVLSGRWSPRKARQDELEHERLVAQELQALPEGLTCTNAATAAARRSAGRELLRPSEQADGGRSSVPRGRRGPDDSSCVRSLPFA